MVGIGLTLYGVPYVAFAARGGRLADRYGPVRIATFGMLVVVPTTLVYGLVAAPLVITGIALIEAVGNATAVPSAQAAMVRACPRDRLAAGQGLSGAISLSAAGVAAAVAAPVYEAAGSAVLFGGAAAVMTGLVATALVLDHRDAHSALRGPSLVAPPLPVEPAAPMG